MTGILRKRALVVDDDEVVRELVVLMLEDCGWTTMTGTDGEEACVVAARELPDLVVMDVMMPLKSGFEAFKELRENPVTAHIPIILLTAVNEFDLGANHSLESVGRHLGVPYPQAFIEKPIDRETFLRAVEEAMAS